MQGTSFFLKLDQGSYIVSTDKTVSEKIWGLIRSREFLYPKAVFILVDSPT